VRRERNEHGSIVTLDWREIVGGYKTEVTVDDKVRNKLKLL